MYVCMYISDIYQLIIISTCVLYNDDKRHNKTLFHENGGSSKVHADNSFLHLVLARPKRSVCIKRTKLQVEMKKTLNLLLCSGRNKAGWKK